MEFPKKVLLSLNAINRKVANCSKQQLEATVMYPCDFHSWKPCSSSVGQSISIFQDYTEEKPDSHILGTFSKITCMHLHQPFITF